MIPHFDFFVLFLIFTLMIVLAYFLLRHSQIKDKLEADVKALESDVATWKAKHSTLLAVINSKIPASIAIQPATAKVPTPVAPATPAAT